MFRVSSLFLLLLSPPNKIRKERNTHQKLNYSKQKQKFSHNSLHRGTLLAELDKTPDSTNLPVEISTTTEKGVTEIENSNSSSNSYFIPSHYAKKFEKTLMNSNISISNNTNDYSSLNNKNNEDHNLSNQKITSQEELKAQQTALREMFNDAEKRCIRLHKDLTWLNEERRTFQLSHGRPPTKKEVTPFINIPLAPTAALKLLKHLSPNSSAREAVVQSILLQQNIRNSKLVQSSERTLFRCLRCFHIYAAKPRTLLREKVGHSWLEYEKEKNKVEKAKELSQRPSLRKFKYSVGRQRDNFTNNPTCCPMCKSEKAQWVMEYIHHRTHA